MSEQNCQSGDTMSLMDPDRYAGSNGAAEFSNWIKRKLGHPQVRIELTNDQIFDAMQEALQKYVSVAERPVKYFSQATISGLNVYPLPDDWMGMTEQIHYLPNSITAMIQTYTAYNMYLNFTGNLDITAYETLMSNLQLKLNRIGAVPTFEILYNPPRLKVYPAPSQSNNYIVYAYVAMPKLENWTPQVDMVGYEWVRKYALALTKFTLGRIRSRYGDTITAGDQAVTGDGGVLIGEAKEEMATLEEDLELLRTPMPVLLF